MGDRHGISFGSLRSCVRHRIGWRRQCAVRERRPGQARRLSGQRDPDLRQLPHPEGAAGRHHGQGVFRRPVVGRASIQGDGAQHHARQGDRYRELYRRGAQAGHAQGHQAQRRAGRDDHAERILRDHDGPGSRCGHCLFADDQADQEHGGGPGLQDSTGSPDPSRRRQAFHRCDDERHGARRAFIS